MGAWVCGWRGRGERPAASARCGGATGGTERRASGGRRVGQGMARVRAAGNSEQQQQQRQRQQQQQQQRQEQQRREPSRQRPDARSIGGDSETKVARNETVRVFGRQGQRFGMREKNEEAVSSSISCGSTARSHLPPRYVRECA
jgi:transcription initiation factor TFIID subunit TAF12